MRRSKPSANQHLADAPFVVVDGFLPGKLAMAMRRDIDAHFAAAGGSDHDTPGVWDYRYSAARAHWYADLARVIDDDRVSAFRQALRDWSATHFGMAEVAETRLRLYLGGCGDKWHSGPRDAVFSFVYSLTRNERRSTGGETLVMGDDDRPFRIGLAQGTPESALYQSIEPRFNRLLIFDARLPNAIERVDGSMDPAEGCVFLCGQLREGSAIAAGALPASAITGSLNEALATFAANHAAAIGLYHGPLALRLTIAASGTVEACEILVDRVLHPDPGHVDWEPLRATLIARLKALKFAGAGGRTVLIQPVRFGRQASE